MSDTDQNPTEDGNEPSARHQSFSARHARSRRLQRLVDDGPRVTGRSWVQLVLLVTVLVLLFATREELGRRAAGCYGHVAEPTSEATPAADQLGVADDDPPAAGVITAPVVRLPSPK